jgi:rhodanese-related sulfurtransferase
MIFKNILICFIFFTIFSCKEISAQHQTKIISPQEMFKLTNSGSAQLIDVRTPKEFKQGHLNRAKNIDFSSSNFFKDISLLDKEKPVFIYCHSGGRSGKSVNDFLNAGFTEVYDLKGGIVNWKSEGLPIVTDK